MVLYINDVRLHSSLWELDVKLWGDLDISKTNIDRRKKTTGNWYILYCSMYISTMVVVL